MPTSTMRRAGGDAADGGELLRERHRRLAEQHAEGVHRLRAPAPSAAGSSTAVVATCASARATSRSVARPAAKSRRVSSSVSCCVLTLSVAMRDALLQAAIGDVVAADLTHQA